MLESDRKVLGCRAPSFRLVDMARIRSAAPRDGTVLRRSARLANAAPPVSISEEATSVAMDVCASPETAGQLCIACQDQPRAVRCRPCGHGVMCAVCTVKHIGSTVGDGTAPYRCVICRDNVGMLEYHHGCQTAVPTAVKESEPPVGEVLGVVAFLRARAQDETDQEIAAAAAAVLQAAGRAVKAPVRGALFSSREAPPGTPLESSHEGDAAYDEYLSMEDAILDLWDSPAIPGLPRMSDYMGATPPSRASPTAMTERAESPDVQMRRSRRRPSISTPTR